MYEAAGEGSYTYQCIDFSMYVYPFLKTYFCLFVPKMHSIKRMNIVNKQTNWKKISGAVLQIVCAKQKKYQIPDLVSMS